MKLPGKLTAVQRLLIKVGQQSKNNTLLLYVLPALLLFLVTNVNRKFPVFTDTITLQYAAVIILTAWYCGLIPSLLTIAAAVFLADHYFLPDNNVFHHDIFFLIVFIPTSLIISSLVMSQRQAIDTINTLALHDGLTGLANRRLFYEQIELLSQMAKRGQTRFGLIYIDVDNFKNINDQYGHHMGDQVLKHVAATLQDSARREDIVSRYGGDEFIIVLNTLSDMEEATQIAQRIAEAFSEDFTYQSVTTPVSVSMGLAIYPEHGSTHEQLIRQADQALYKAKTSGRNIYVLA